MCHPVGDGVGCVAVSDKHRVVQPVRTRVSTVLAFAVTLALAAGCASGSATAARPGPAPTSAPRSSGPAPIGHSGRWLTDASRRVVLLHGMNLVAKFRESPAARGFGADDATWLAANGFDVVRLGLVADAIMPTPGVIDAAYLRSFTRTVDLLTTHGLLVLIDLHQDGWGPVTSGDGFPAWMTFTHGARNTHTPFPLYYITNPAIQAAFDSFWANDRGPGGVGIEDQVAKIWGAIAAAVGSNPGVMGYDVINEPWPGTTWSACLNNANGCPARDASGLDPFDARIDRAIRARDARHLVFAEPYVLFNFGLSRTHVARPGGDPASGLSFHMYTSKPAQEPDVLANAAAWSARTGGALLNTEFGATTDPATIDRMVAELDHGLLPWIWWSYDELVPDMTKAPAGANIAAAAVAELVRPHPFAIAGTPTSLAYDPHTRVMQVSWSTTGPDRARYPAGTDTVIKVPPTVYAQGYSVRVSGGQVTSAPNAATLSITNNPAASTVTVRLQPS
jgi:endoglycosylceramidase